MRESAHYSRIRPVDASRANGPIRRLLAEIEAKTTLVPNPFRIFANAPAALEGRMGLAAPIAAGAFNEKTPERIAPTVVEGNLCPYRLSMRKAAAAKIVLNRSEIEDAIHASAADARTDAILKLARSIVVQRGELSDADFAGAVSQA